ncbi:MAG: FHA domain-containing protein [Alphaproteobacteria bacterium]|nr:FHA domain-containing protein [Alphaproteobacteria bacterium]
MGNVEYKIGRSPFSDILLADSTVSSFHAELVIGGGRYFLQDCASKNGTWVRHGTRWQRHDKGYVEPDLRLRLGGYETTLRDLLARVAGGKRSAKPPPPKTPPAKRRGRVRRDSRAFIVKA